MSLATPTEIAVLFNKSAAQKDAFSTPRLFVYSIMGGAFIALGGLLALVVTGGMPAVAAANPGIIKFIFGALFPLGLILVVVAGAELFTSDCAVIPFALLHKKTRVRRLLRIWGIVYVGNFIGALIVAWLFAYETGILSTGSWLAAAQKIGVTKTSHHFWETFVKGIGANWLVCMAVWAAYAAKDVTGKAVALWFPVMCFVAFGFEHSIANMFFIPTSMMLGAPITMYQFLVVNMIPAALGNIVGGVVFVALPYWFMFRDASTLPIAAPNKATNEYSHREKEPLENHLN